MVAPYSPNPHRYKTRNKKARAIDSKEWNRLIEVYKKWDGRTSLVAVELGWPVARTHRVWKRGYPSLGLPPIQTVLAKDALAADDVRAERQKIQAVLPPPAVEVKSPAIAVQKAHVLAAGEAKRIAAMVQFEETRQLARQDAIQARAEEAMLVTLTRRNALALNGMTSNMLNGALELSKRIEVELKAAAKNSRLSLQDKLGLVKTAASIARFNAEASVLAVKAERLVLGSPIDAPEDSPQDGENTLQESERWINVAIKALGKAKDRGVLTADGETVETKQ